MGARSTRHERTARHPVTATLAALVFAGATLGISACLTPEEGRESPPEATTTAPDGAATAGKPHPVRPARAESDTQAESDEDVAARLQPAGVTAEVPEANAVVLTARDDEAFAEVWRERTALAFRELRRIFPPRERAVEPATVLIFPDREGYEAYAEHFAPENHPALGYYDPVRRELVMAESDRDEALFATLLHESTHLVLRDFLGHRYPPAWLDEGLATYYETGVLVEDEETGEASIRFGEVHEEFLRLAERHLAANAPVDVRRFATMDFDSFADVGTSTLRRHYALSWSLVYYLLNGERGRFRAQLQLYLDEIAAAPDPQMRYVRAFDLCFRPVMYSFELGWAHWVRRAARKD